MTSRDKPLRIAMLGHKTIPSREGGIEVVVEELATRMAALGHDVTCYNRRKRGAGRGPKTYKGVRLKPVFTVDRGGLAAMTSSTAAAIRAAFGRYDAVHFHAEGPCAAIWLPKLFGKRCVATIHGLDHKRAKWGRFAAAYILHGEKNAARYADEIIVLSESARDYFKETYGRETVLIPNGVSPAEPVPPGKTLASLGLAARGYLLFVGRLVPEKGIHTLITAFRGVSTDKKLVIVGGSGGRSDYEAELKSLAETDPRVIFAGFREGEALAELFSNPYLYVLPSELEGMPLSLLEAMSYGNACLTSDVPECTEVTGSAAFSFRRGDVSDLRSVLQTLIDDPARVEAARAGAAEHVLRRYNWDDVTARTLALYRKAEP